MEILPDDLLENVVIEPALDKPQIISPTEYQSNPDCVKSLKLPQIKENLRHYKNLMYVSSKSCFASIKEMKQVIITIHDFALTGTKPKILDRLQAYFIQEDQVKRIQCVMRGRFVRNANKLRSEYAQSESDYVNDTDFYTLEPISNIDHMDLFKYTETGLTYTFVISSLNKLMKQTGAFVNPYTRRDISHLRPIIQRLVTLNTIIQSTPDMVRQRRERKPTNGRRRRACTMIEEDNLYDRDAMVAFIREMRSKTSIERTRALFAEMDSLGNYTHYIWFTELDKRGFYTFFRHLKDIWTYRAQIPVPIKQQICPLWDPFSIVSASTVHLFELEEEQIESVCLTIMEDMVYTGISTEYKTLGAFHVLSALTIVSRQARNALPWLYESLP